MYYVGYGGVLHNAMTVTPTKATTAAMQSSSLAMCEAAELDEVD